MCSNKQPILPLDKDLESKDKIKVIEKPKFCYNKNDIKNEDDKTNNNFNNIELINHSLSSNNNNGNTIASESIHTNKRRLGKPNVSNTDIKKKSSEKYIKLLNTKNLISKDNSISNNIHTAKANPLHSNKGFALKKSVPLSEEESKDKSTIFNKSVLLNINDKVEKNENIRLDNNNIINNIQNIGLNNNKNNLSNTNNKIKIITKDNIIIPDRSLENCLQENNNFDTKIKENKEFENFLKPNSTHSNHFQNSANINPIFNQYLFQNPYLTSSLGSNYNNLIQPNSFNSLTFLASTTPSNRGNSNNFISMSNLAQINSNNNNFSSLYSGVNNCATPTPTTPNNFSSNLISLNNFNEINSSNALNNIQNNFNNLNNIALKKETIDFSDLQSIKVLNQSGGVFCSETPATLTDHNLNTISSLMDLNSFSSLRKSNRSSSSPLVSNPLAHPSGLHMPEKVPQQYITGLEILDNSNLKNLYYSIAANDASLNKNNNEKFQIFSSLINNNNNNCGNPIISSPRNALYNTNANSINLARMNSTISNESFVKMISNFSINNQNINNINNKESNSSNITNIPSNNVMNNKNNNNNHHHKEDLEKSEKYEYIKKDSNSSINSALSNKASVLNNIVFEQASPCVNLNQEFNTPNNTNFNRTYNQNNYGFNKSNGKKSNFTLLNKINNINNYNSYNIKISNSDNNNSQYNNNNVSTPSNCFINDGSKIHSFEDLITKIKKTINFSGTATEVENLNINNIPIKTSSNDSNSKILFGNNKANAPKESKFADNKNKEINTIQDIKEEDPTAEFNSMLVQQNSNKSLETQLEENFENLENCIDQYIKKFLEEKDKLQKIGNRPLEGFTGSFEVLNSFREFDNLKTFVEKILFHKIHNPILFHNICEKYHCLYADSDCEIKFVILKKILSDCDKNFSQSKRPNQNNHNTNLTKQVINSYNIETAHNDSTAICDWETKKQQELLKFGFKDMADKYYSNIHKNQTSSNMTPNITNSNVIGSNDQNLLSNMINNDKTPKINFSQ